MSLRPLEMFVREPLGMDVEIALAIAIDGGVAYRAVRTDGARGCCVARRLSRRAAALVAVMMVQVPRTGLF